MGRIVLFGAGLAGQRAYSYLKQDWNIIAFADNNVSLHGKSLMGLPIISPCSIENYEVDYVYVSSMYQNEIVNQLTEVLNFKKDKIKLLEPDVLRGRLVKGRAGFKIKISLAFVYAFFVLMTVVYIR